MVSRSINFWWLEQTGLLVLVSLLLSACGDTQAPTKDNFAAALKPLVVNATCRQMEGNDVLVSSDPLVLPPPLPILRRSLERLGDRVKLAALDRYVEAGILARTEAVVPERQSDNRMVPSRVLTYAPTPAGREIVAAHDIVRNKRHLTVAMLCLGHGEVVAVDSSTPSIEMMGMKITRVGYRWRAAGMSDWARRAIAIANPAIAASLGQDQAATATPVLTDGGWVDSQTLGV